MDYTYWAVLADTLFVLLAYIYFYVLYRERYMGYWIASWVVFFGRLLLFDYGPFEWKKSLIGFSLFQLSIFVCALLFLKGIHLFVQKPVNRYWLYGAAATLCMSTISAAYDLSVFFKLLLPTFYAAAILIYIGALFVHNVHLRGRGNYITGFAFILWGVLTLIMPYTITVAWLSPLCYLAAGVARLIIALGILIVYFEKTRSDLVTKESQYRLLAENAVDVIYRLRLGPEPRFEYISPSALAVTGHSPEEFYGDPRLMERIIHPEDAPSIVKYFRNPSPSGDLPLSFRLLRENQEVVWLEHKGSLTDDKDGTAMVEGIFRDVTARKNMEQIIFQSEKMNLVGQMAVSVAHEIRNPLTSVRGYLQLIRMKEDCPNKERYDLMIDELDRTNTIISEYLLLAKDKVPDRKECCLNKIIEAVLPLLQANAAATKASIIPSLGVIPELNLDENEIRQMLFNIVNNGLEAMPVGGELIIRTFSTGDKVVLAISDQGSGIPPHVLTNLGTPFTTTKTNGTGLGLPVCYRIANRHDATIKVETSGQGTTFLVEFSPLQTAV